MNKQQYKNSHRLIRLLRYEQQLESVFRYPIGFDCECGGSDSCDYCEDEGVERAAAREALELVKAEIAKLLPLVERKELAMVAATLKPNYKVYLWYCELGDYFQETIIKRLERGESGMSSWSKKTLFDWWMESIKERRQSDEIGASNIRDMQHALTHRRVDMRWL